MLVGKYLEKQPHGRLRRRLGKWVMKMSGCNWLWNICSSGLWC